ncbi:MAG: alpha/beta hydrolase-fold protein [Chloroflexota bacterium]
MSERATVEMVTVPGKLLEGNPLGDPAAREMPVILPPGYDPNSSRRYPLLVALSGFTGRGIQMLNFDPWQPNLPARLTRLYDEGMPHAIVALPDCFTKLGGSQYVNSEAVGRYEDYVIDEIVPFVDANFRTLVSPESRAVFGKSSGGYGAIMLGMKHPDVFGALACHSGDMYFDLCYKPDFPDFCNVINRAGGLEAWWHGFLSREKKTQDDFTGLNTLAMAACYSPDPAGFMGIALPFDLYTCEQRDDVWARWLEHDPIEVVANYADNLRSLRYIYLDCGTRDEFNLQYGARIMSRKLTELNIPHDHEEFEDGHMSVQYRYSVSLPRLLAKLEHEK